MNFTKGRYQAYVRHGENGLVFRTNDVIIRYLDAPVRRGKRNLACVEKAMCGRGNAMALPMHLRRIKWTKETSK